VINPLDKCEANHRIAALTKRGRVSEQVTKPQPRPSGTRGRSFEASAPIDDTMLSAEVIRAIQNQLGGTTASPLPRGQERKLGLISDHMLPDFLGKIRQQLG
jgi:hypothetical protein